MGCRKIIFVVCMLVSVLDAKPWLRRRYLFAPPGITTKRLVQTYIRAQSSENCNPTTEDTAEIVFATIRPVDEATALSYKIPILHKINRDIESIELPARPLELNGFTFSGINYWFNLDYYYNELDVDEEFYECYQEFIEVLPEEYDVYDIDKWEYEQYFCV